MSRLDDGCRRGKLWGVPSPSIPNRYPLELAPPDISAYAAGDAGVPYVWTFAAAGPGPHALITAAVHGNEPCGAIALDWLLRRGVRPRRGRLSLAFVNVNAYSAFDPDDPNASRWVDEDFNRVWAPEALDGPRDSVELRRARALRPLLDEVDALLDIHSMQHRAPPLMMCGWAEKGARLAARVGLPERVVADRGHAAGRRMRDYAGFGNPSASPTALLVECGQHWQAAAASLAKASAARFLAALDMADDELVAAAGGPKPRAQSFWEVVEAVTIESESFRFARDFTGGEVIAEAGATIGWDGPREVRTPFADCMLVMPSQRLYRGQTALRLARRRPPPEA